MNIQYHRFKKFFRTLRHEGSLAAFRKVKAHYAKKAVPIEIDYNLPISPILSAPHDGVNFPNGGEQPQISIIIPVYNQWNRTWNCLATIPLACQRYSYEVILADDGSTDETFAEASKIPNLRICRDGQNRRFVRNCNRAAEIAKGTLLFFLNNDTKCAPNSIDALADMLEARPEIGIVGSKLIYPDGRLQECGGIVYSDGSAANYGNGLNPQLPGFMHPRQVDYVSGAALMIRHQLWQEYGGFDDRYAPAYYEDTDLCMAMRHNGHEVWVEPASVVIHYEGASNGTNTSTGLKAYQVRNQAVFAEKWHESLIAQHLPANTTAWMAAEKPLGRIGILVVDHYIPTPDQDAGSACTRHYLETLARLGHRVIFLGENFVRSEPYTTQLERLGIEAWVGNWHANHWRQALMERGHGIDLVLFNRPHITSKFLPDIQKALPHAIMTYFGHDLHCLREERAAALLPAGPARDAKIANALSAKKQEAAIYDRVQSALTISSDEQEQITQTFGFKDITTFPGYAFPIRSRPHTPPQGPPTYLFVGGFNHHPNQDGVEWFLEKIWPLVLQKMPDARFWIVGSKMPDAYKTLGQGIEALGKLSDEELGHRYAHCHAVVVPLRYGAGLKGKVVQALSEGLPIISTSVGVEGLPLELKQALHPHNEPGDFATAMVESVTTYGMQIERRILSLRWAAQYFSKESSCQFFKQWIIARVPPIKCLGGVSHDGWSGGRVEYRLSPGRYLIATWCPEFHFIKSNDTVTLSVHDGNLRLGQHDHIASGHISSEITVSSTAVISMCLNRTTSPLELGIGKDQRCLGVKVEVQVMAGI